MNGFQKQVKEIIEGILPKQNIKDEVIFDGLNVRVWTKDLDVKNLRTKRDQILKKLSESKIKNIGFWVNDMKLNHSLSP